MYKDRIKELRRVKASELIPSPHNWRQHPQYQRDALEAMLSDVGFADAVLVRETDGGLEIIDGHLRSSLDDDQEVPVLVLDVNEEEAKKLLLTIDPLAAMAGTDVDALTALLADVTFDAGSITSMLDGLLEGGFEPLMPKEAFPSAEEDEATASDAIDEVEAEAYVPFSKRGQIWTLGKHRLMCGDSTAPAAIAALMAGETAALVAADPPYGMGKEKDGIANDNLYREKLDAFQMAWWNAARKHVEDNGSAYIWGNSEDLWRLWYAGGLKDSERLTFRNEIVWDKGGGGMSVGTDAGRMYQSSERCLFFMLGEQGYNNNADNYWQGWEPIRAALAADVEKMGWTADDITRITGVGMFSHWFTESQWMFIPEHHYQALQAAAHDEAFKREHGAFKREHEAFKREHDDLKREFYGTRAYFDNAHDNMTDVWSFSRVEAENAKDETAPKFVATIKRAMKTAQGDWHVWVSRGSQDSGKRDVWSFPRVIGEERHGHATPKPIVMIERIMKSSSKDGAVIYDPFCGTGPTIIAAEKLGRRCYAMEIEPRYCDATIKRWEAFTGKQAVLLQ
jgi:DNA modification methylase